MRNGFTLPKDDSALYTELSVQALTDIDVKLIPYCAWKKRGVSEMAVWLPLDWWTAWGTPMFACLYLIGWRVCTIQSLQPHRKLLIQTKLFIDSQ